MPSQSLVRSKSQPEQLDLYGRPETLPPEEADSSGYETALELFCSFLCQADDDREGMSNLLWFWDSLPIWSGEHLNRVKSGEELPNLLERRLVFEGQELEVLISPGTIETTDPDTGNVVGKRMYPGPVEMMVEHAIIKLASDRIYASEWEGRSTPIYSVTFSLSQIRKVMESLGAGIPHRRLREALDVLSTTIITIRDGHPDQSGKRRTRREAILPGFSRMENVRHNDQDQWKVNLHPIVTQGINNATYRQYRVDKLKRLAPYGVYMLRQMLLTCHTLSTQYPYQVTFQELQEMSSGLSGSRLTDCISRVERELRKMKDERIITNYEVERIYRQNPKAKKGGRPKLVGAEFTLVPSHETVSEVKAASKRQSHIEQTLNLSRSKRGDRRRFTVETFLSQSSSTIPVRTARLET